MLLTAVLLIVITGCSGGGGSSGSSSGSSNGPILPTAKAITAFSIAGVDLTINEAEKTITVSVPFGQNVTAMVATFTTTGTSVKVGSTIQISGVTANDFTNPVVYTVTAADGSSQDYIATVTVTDNGDKAWICVAASTVFSPRDSSPNAVLYYRNAFWILEGYRYTGFDYFSSSDVWYSTDGRFWTLVNDNPPYYPYSVFVVFDDYMWAIGGIDSYRSQDGLNWERVDPGPYNPMRGTVFQDKIWILDYDQRVWSSEDGLAWTLITDETPWQARYWPAWLSLNGRLWLFGGAVLNDPTTTDTDVYYNDVWASEDGMNWSLITSAAPWSGRYWSGYAAYDEKLWILGGYREDNKSVNWGNLNDVWFSGDGVLWEKQNDVQWKWSPRHAMFVWVAEGRLWISSGYSGGGDLHNDVWQLLP